MLLIHDRSSRTIECCDVGKQEHFPVISKQVLTTLKSPPLMSQLYSKDFFSCRSELCYYFQCFIFMFDKQSHSGNFKNYASTKANKLALNFSYDFKVFKALP